MRREGHRLHCAEHAADDITADIAATIARRLDPSEGVRPEVFDFIEAHVGLAFTRGLRRAEPAFAPGEVEAAHRRRRAAAIRMGRRYSVATGAISVSKSAELSHERIDDRRGSAWPNGAPDTSLI